MHRKLITSDDIYFISLNYYFPGIMLNLFACAFLLKMGFMDDDAFSIIPTILFAPFICCVISYYVLLIINSKRKQYNDIIDLKDERNRSIIFTRGLKNAKRN